MTILSGDRDFGLQAERTQFAWQRTALSTLALTLIILRTGVARGSVWLTITALVSVTMALQLLFISYHSRSDVQHIDLAVFKFRKAVVVLIISLDTMALVLSHII